MSAQDNGGSAFASVTTQYNDREHKYELSDCNEGISLRDYFAAKAMQGLLASGRDAHYAEVSMEAIARASYAMADSMIEARSA